MPSPPASMYAKIVSRMRGSQNFLMWLAIPGTTSSARCAKLLLGARCERLAAGGLAGFGAAKLEHAPAGGLVAEVVIEGHRAVDLGARKIERLSHHRNLGLGHTAKNMLKCMQNGQGGAILVLMRRDDRARALGVPWLISRHAQAAPLG
jgi:hypothetical protein